MRKIYLLFFLTALSLTTTAQTIRFADIDRWIGQGSDSAAVAIIWNDGKTNDTLVWGYKFSGQATGADMMEAIAKADPRLYISYTRSATLGVAINAIGYDRDNNAKTGIRFEGKNMYQPDGWYLVTGWNPPTAADSTDHFAGGFVDNKFFNYLTAEGEGSFVSSSVGASSRSLRNGSRDVWVYKTWGGNFALSDYIVAPQTPTYADGVFLLNEGWFGHESGHVNFLAADGTLSYRVFSSANADHSLGNTSQYGALYGGRLYFMSKQSYSKDGKTGGRLIVANAANMAVIKSFATLPNGGDGRAFAVVTDSKAYVSTSKGLLTYDLAADSLGSTLAVTTQETGNILRAGRYAFVETKDKTVLVIDPQTDTLVTTIAAAYQPVLSKDGRVWVVSQNTLKAIDPYTLADAGEIDVTGKAPSFAIWAWNAGLFFAGNKTNSLYWAHGTSFTGANKVYRVHLDDAQPQAQEIYSISGETTHIYGSAIRLRPSDDHIFMQTFKGFADQTYRIHEIDGTGTEVAVRKMQDHYWFPTLPIFTDSANPVFTAIEAKTLTVNTPDTISISVTDADSYESAIRVTGLDDALDCRCIETEMVGQNRLKILGTQAGTYQVTLEANSFGLLSTVAFAVTVNDATVGIRQAEVVGTLSVSGHSVRAENLAGETLAIYTLDGRLVARHLLASAHEVISLPAAPGTYVLKTSKLSLKVVH